MFSPLVLWPSLIFIMNYPLCITHYLATANHHDHAWTENWANNNCKLSMPISTVRLLFNPRQHRQRGHFYRMYGTWKNYPPQHALLNVGFMTILRRSDCFILKWTCSAVLAVSRNCHVQIAPASKRNPHKNKNVVLFAAMLYLETMSVELHGRSHPAHNAPRMVYHMDHRPCGCQGIKS